MDSQIGWLGEDTGSVQVTPLLTASMLDKGDGGRINRGEKNVVVSIGRRVRNGDHTLDVIGSGGRATVTLAPGGEVLSVARTWRQTELTQEQVAIKPFERAQAEAMKRLRNADAHKLADWRFGYKEAAANVVQRELPVVYEFDYVPKERERMIDFPPQRIEVPAEDQ